MWYSPDQHVGGESVSKAGREKGETHHAQGAEFFLLQHLGLAEWIGNGLPMNVRVAAPTAVTALPTGTASCRNNKVLTQYIQTERVPLLFSQSYSVQR